MPDKWKCTCCPRDLRAVQQICFFIMMDLQMLEDRLTATRKEIILPDNADAIWEGQAPPTVETEIYGTFSIILDDHLPELIELLHRAAVATQRKVRIEWTKLRAGKPAPLQIKGRAKTRPKPGGAPLPFFTD